jgi:hypothetical protein
MQQTSSVAEYVECFAALVDQLTAYDHVTDPVYYAMRFVDGLRDDIRSVVALHRPSSFDAAATLALLQDDVGVNDRSRRKMDYHSAARQPPRGPLPLPPPPRIDKQPLPVLPDEKKLCEGKSPEERMAALRSYRKAKGLCIRCAERWSREHKCAASVQLHVVQELLELFNMEDLEKLSSASDQQDFLFMAISQEAVTGTEGPRTMRLQGTIHGLPALILVDSGSTHTFLSQSFALSLQHVSPTDTNIKVQVANGAVLHCTGTLQQVQWSVDDCIFHTDMKLLPLLHFDMIVGMDWLEAFSPMQVHWRHKWMVIPYQGSTAMLQGITPKLVEEVIVHVCSLMEQPAIDPAPMCPEVAALLEEFAAVFAPLSALPP